MVSLYASHVFYKLGNPNLYSRNIIYPIFNEQLEYWNTSMEYKNNLTCFSRTTFIQYTRCRLHAVTNQVLSAIVGCCYGCCENVHIMITIFKNDNHRHQEKGDRSREPVNPISRACTRQLSALGSLSIDCIRINIV